MNNLNFDFLLDIWADLKAKKLAPVAIGLAVAVVAMPVLMRKGEESPSSGTLPILAAATDKGAQVEVSDELADRGSKLDSYHARDPFKGAVKPQTDDAAGDGTASAPAGKTGTPIDPLAGIGGGGPTSSGTSGSSGSTGGTDLGGSSSPPPSLTTPPPADTGQPQKHYLFNFELDLKFGRPGREKRYREVSRLTFLPKPSLPALLFMGVTAGEKSAIFFVHPGLTHQGEGECVPSPDNCNFLKLKIGEQHYLAANDHEFRIELLHIRRVKLSDEKQQQATARKTSQGRRSARSMTDGATAGASAAPSDEQEFPWLADGIG
jgi:hypothetical protein